MHVLFVHNNFPAQFGHIARDLIAKYGFECTFLSQLPTEWVGKVRRIQYKTNGGATESTHYCSRTFENYIWNSHAAYETMQQHPEIRPDLVVGHSGFGSTVFLADLYNCPIVNYFEYFYRSFDSDMDFRPEFPPIELDILRARARNAMILLDLETSQRGYSPTVWQRSLLPKAYQKKIETIFDGIDTRIWNNRTDESTTQRKICDQNIPHETKIVTYVSRGFESMRGFDIFMKIAKRICDERSDVVFVCVGSDRVCYGGDLNRIQEESFRKHVLAQDDYDLDRFIFTGVVPPPELARILKMSDLHIYLTAPFVLSWSLFNALSCGCTILASNTEPVRELIVDEKNGLLVDFYDVDRFVTKYSNDTAVNSELGRNVNTPVQKPASIVGKHLWPSIRPQPSDNFLPAITDQQRQTVTHYCSGPLSSFISLGEWADDAIESILQYFESAIGFTLVNPSENDAKRYDQLCSRYWDYKMRLQIMRTTNVMGLRQLAREQFSPDVVLVSAEGKAENIRREIFEAHRLFPKSRIIGINWNQRNMQTIVEELASKSNLDVDVEHDVWSVWNENL